MENLAPTAAPAIKAEIAIQKTIAISNQTYISAIHSAAMSSKFALNLELAVGLSVFSEAGRITRESKRQLANIYSDAGYACKTQYDADYKTVMRRISVAAELFDFIGHEKVDEWIGGNAEMAIINSLTQHLERYELKSINGVLALVGKPVLKAISTTAEEPPTELPKLRMPEDEGELSTSMANAMQEALLKKAEEKPVELNRRDSDVEGAIMLKKAEAAEYVKLMRTLSAKREYRHIEVNGIEIDIPPAATRDDVFGAAMALLQHANELGATTPPKVVVPRAVRSKRQPVTH